METIPFTIAVTPEQKAQLQLLAEAEGLTVEGFALKQLLKVQWDDMEMSDALCELLSQRIVAARRGEVSCQSFDAIIAEADSEYGA